MKKAITMILLMALSLFFLPGASAEVDCSPYELLGKLMESLAYTIDSGSSLETTMVPDDQEGAAYPVTVVETCRFHGRTCEVTISGDWYHTSRITLTARHGQLRMDENAMFPEELHVYHDLHYLVCSVVPEFGAIPDGYDIDTLIDRPGTEYFDQQYFDSEGWKWITREPMRISLANRSRESGCRFSAEVQEDGTVLIQWTF